ncbi:CotS family spore coat protein [Clostridium carnis]
MNRLKYTDKNTLCKYDLSEEFFNSIGIEVEDIIPLRKVFVISTKDGKKILKMVDSSAERLEFIDNALKYISPKYENVLSYYKNKKDKIYEKWGENIYVILNMVEGREATFTNPIEIEMCAESIAKMHNASINIFKNLDDKYIKGNVGKYLPKYLEESKVDLLNIKEYVSKFRYKNTFDKLFMENVDYSIKEIEKSIELLAISQYHSILEDDNKRVLCHNDLAHHNFIIDGEEVKIIDFDYCQIDTRVVDIANYMIKVIKNSYYDIEKAKSIIDSYNKVAKLDKEEIKLLYAIITFPKDFVTISKDYYYKQKSWEYEVFLNRLNNKLENESYRKEFLVKFVEEFNDFFY